MHKLGGRASLFWVAGGVAIAMTLSALATRNPAFAALALGPIAAVTIFTKRPKTGFLLWLISVTAIPCWIGVNGGVFIPASLAGSLIALTCLLANPTWRPSKADLSIVLLLAACVLGVAFGSSAGESSVSGLTSMLVWWIPGYLVGRFACERAGFSFVKVSVGVAFGVVGALAVIERLFSWHVFAGQMGMNSLAQIWAPIQIRGGVERSEWAFGHSIALGGSLAISIPFLLSASLRTRTKMLLLICILGGVATTLSRGAMLAAGLTLLLALFSSSNLKKIHKVLLSLGSFILGAFVVADFTEVSDNAGAEAADSSGYRMAMLVRLLPTLEPIGRSTSYLTGADGKVQYGYFTSIDNAFLALGLGFGWFAMLVVVTPFVFMGIRFLKRRASFAEVALLGQLPVITTVAMITQYQVVVWMVAGLAATLAVSDAGNPSRTSSPASPSFPALCVQRSDRVSSRTASS